jgi:hypothetical protein
MFNQTHLFHKMPYCYSQNLPKRGNLLQIKNKNCKLQLDYKSMKFLALLILCLSSLAHAAQDALIMKERAIIYADIHRKHPIGYVRQWQRVRVGTVARAGGTVMPVAISKNRIGYISVDDFSIGRDSYSISNINKQLDQSSEDRPLKNNLQLSFDNFFAEASISDSFFGTSLLEINYLGFSGYYNFFYNNKFDFTLGASILSASAADGAKISHMIIKPGIEYKLPSWLDRWQFSAQAHFGFSPVSKLSSTVFNQSGMAYGADAGLSAKYALTRRAWLSTSLGYQYLQFSGFDLPNNLGEFNLTQTGVLFSMALNLYL